ncbi:MAG: phage tail tape measure protein [Lachnospiraceae bacterium]|nr:phage tail tape measure protein [Lachnospiraceae bacterium]
MANNEAKVKFTADVSEFNSAIKTANSTMKELQSALKLNAAQMEESSSATDGLRTKLSLLEKESETLADKKEALNQKLEQAIKYFGEDSTQAASLRTQLNNVETQSTKVAAEIEATNQELQEQEEAAAKSETALEKLTRTIDEQEAELSSLKTQYTNAVLEFGETSEEAEDLAGQIKDLSSDLKENKDSLDSATDAMEKLGDESEEAGKKGAEGFEQMYDALVSAGLVEAVKKLGEGMSECVSTAASFESQMSVVESLSGATAEEMDVLTEAAKEMGATTSFTATEAGEALEYMALAGWETEEMVEGLSGVVNLAAASAMDLGTASDIVTDYLSAFGLSASDADAFVDKLTYAMSSSNTTTEQLGEAYKNCAATATQLGYDLDETTAVLMVMANAGIKGGEAGTALSSIMTRLGNNVSGCRDLLESYNIEVYDAQGNVNSLSDILSGMQEVWAGLTDEQKSNLSYTVAGKTAQSELMTVLGDTTGSLEEYTEGLRDCTGAAQEMAETRLDNFNGQITLLDSAMDALKTTMGEAVLPTLTEFAEITTDGVTALNDFLSTHEGVTAALVSLGVGLAAATIALAATSTAAKKLATSFLELTAAMATNPITLAAVAIAGLGTAVATFVALTGDASSEVTDLKDEVSNLTDTVNENAEAYEESNEQNETAAENYSDMAEELSELLDVTDRTTAQQERLESIIEQLNEAFPELAIAYDETTDAINMSDEALLSYLDTQAEQAQYESDVERMNELYEEQAEATALLEEAKTTLAEKEEEFAEQQQTYINMGEAYADAIDSSRIELGNYQQAVDEAEAALETINTELEEVTGKINEYGDAAAESENDTDIAVNAMENLVTSLEALEEGYTEAYDAALESLQGQMDLWDQASEIAATSAEDITTALESQIEYWTTYAENLENLNNRNIEGLDAYVASVDDGSTEAANYIAGMASMSDEELQALMDTYEELSEAQGRVATDSADMATQYSENVAAMVEEATTYVADLDLSEEAQEAGINTLLGYIQGMEEQSTGACEAMTTILGDVVAAAREALDSHSPSVVYEEMGSDAMLGFINGAYSQEADLLSTMQTLSENGINRFKQNSSSTTLVSSGSDTIGGYIKGASAKAPSLYSGMESYASTAIKRFKDQASSTSLYSAGTDTLQGFINGLNAKCGELYEKMQSVASSALKKFKSALGIESPSKEMKAAALDTGEGYLIGLDEEQPAIDARMTELAQSALSNFRDHMSLDAGSLNASLQTTYSAAWDTGNPIQDYIQNQLDSIASSIDTAWAINYDELAEAMAKQPVSIRIGNREFARVVKEVV